MLRALTAGQSGEICSYTGRRVIELTRLGRFPAPIDDQLNVKSWRWSSMAVESYAAGEWTPPSYVPAALRAVAS